jgi:hypothetical protein
MQSEPMMVDPYLQHELKPGEQLLWWGKPDPRHRARAGNASALSMTNIIIYSILALVMVGLIVFDMQLFQEESALGGIESTTVFLFIVSVVLLGVYLYRLSQIYRQYMRSTANLRNTVYGITNERVIVITTTPGQFFINSYRANDIGPINRIETGGGWGDVSYGKMRQVQRGLRTITIVEKLVGIPNARLVEDILTRTFKNSAPAPMPYSSPPPVPPQHYPPTPQHYMPPQGSQAAQYAPQEHIQPQAPQE